MRHGADRRRIADRPGVNGMASPHRPEHDGYRNQKGDGHKRVDLKRTSAHTCVIREPGPGERPGHSEKIVAATTQNMVRITVTQAPSSPPGTL
jgi:hypothetical protein